MGITSVREILKHAYSLKQERNPRYSLRSFARDLSLSPSQMSRLMQGSKGISKKSAIYLAEKLKMSADDKFHFINLAEFEYARSKPAREAAKDRLIAKETPFEPIEKDEFEVVSEWYHFPLLCLIGMDNFQEEIAWISERLEVEKELVLPAIERLLRTGLAIRDTKGHLRPSGDFFANSKGLPSRAARAFHKRFLQKSIVALEEQNTKERTISTLVLSVDDDEFEEAQIFIQQFQSEFKKKFANSSTKKKQIYALGIQYFRVMNAADED